MKKNELKKALYKTKPKAKLIYIRNGNAYYLAEIDDNTIRFEVPIDDMGDADFLPTMDA